MKIKNLLPVLFVLFGFNQQNEAKQSLLHLKFDFGGNNVKKGYTAVSGKQIYDTVTGYGFVCQEEVIDVKRSSGDKLTSDFCTSNKPFYFITDLPEGNYEIKVTLGDMDSKTTTTVKAESRRLMLEKVVTEKGQMVTKSFMVNVRTPQINDSTRINLKSREVNYLNWDNKLTLEFNNENPCVAAIEIIERKDLITVFLAGNSTVVDQEYEPWSSWGQMITRFFGPEVVVANFAESGETLQSFMARGRLKKILSLMKAGDYLFIEFGHNDQKKKPVNYAWEGYSNDLKYFIEEARKKGGIPIVVSSTQRRKFNGQGKIENTHGDYPAAAEKTAVDQGAAFIGLTEMSTNLYEAFGVEQSKHLLVHYPANTYPRQFKALADNTHFNPFGSYEIAKCILQGIKNANIELAKYITEDFEGFDPKQPDAFEAWELPESPFFQMIKPDGY